MHPFGSRECTTCCCTFYIQYAQGTFAVRGNTCAQVCRYCSSTYCGFGHAEGSMRRSYVFLTTPHVGAMLSPSDPVASRRYSALQVFLHLHSFHVPPVLRLTVLNVPVRRSCPRPISWNGRWPDGGVSRTSAEAGGWSRKWCAAIFGRSHSYWTLQKVSEYPGESCHSDGVLVVLMRWVGCHGRLLLLSLSSSQLKPLL